MKKSSRKLLLQRETLVSMTDREIEQVQGASASLVVGASIAATMRVCPAVTARVCPKVVQGAKEASKWITQGVASNAIYEGAKHTLGTNDK